MRIVAISEQEWW